MSYIGNQPLYQAFITDSFSGTGSLTTFTMSVAPANPASVLVAISGVLQDPSTYGVAGTTLTFSAAPPTGTGNISARYLGVPASNVATTAYRTVTEFTATAGQTTFTPPSYTVGYINVYRNGVRLGSADYTASTGSTVVLATAANAGDLIATESFYISSILNPVVNISNITASGTANAYSLLRGDSTWSSINGSATVTSSATSVTLTNTSNRLQQVSMTAFGNSVILPDATTYPSNAVGGVVFIINNNGAIAFDVAATGGGRMFGVAPGQTVEISLSSISTATSGWVATPTSLTRGNPNSLYSNTNLLSYSPTAYNSTNSYTSVFNGSNSLPGNYSMTCTALSTTSVIVTWVAPSTGYVTGVVGTISGTTVTWGTPTIINNARAYTTSYVTALSSTTALVYMQNGGSSGYWIGVAISGTTITPGTISLVDSGGQLCGAAVATSTVIVAVRANATNITLRAIIYNGASAPTYGTSLTGAGSTVATGYTAQIVALNSTTFLATYNVGSGLGARCYTLSGTTLTAGAAGVVLNPTVGYTANLVYISATEALFTTELGWQKLTISGTTITLGAYGVINYMWNQFPANSNTGILTLASYIYAVGTQLVGTTDFLAISGSDYGAAVARYSYNSSGNTVNTKGITLCSNSLLAIYACSVSSTQALVVGLTTSPDGNSNYYPAGYLVALNG